MVMTCSGAGQGHITSLRDSWVNLRKKASRSPRCSQPFLKPGDAFLPYGPAAINNQVDSSDEGCLFRG